MVHVTPNMPIIYSRHDSCYYLLYILWFPIYIPVWLSYDLHLWFYTLGYSVAWDNGIYMRVSLFGLFLRCTSLMGPWPKRIKSLLLIISFISDFLFYAYYVIPVLTYLPPEYFLLGIICTLVLFLLHHLVLALLAWGVSLTPLDLTSRSWS